MKSVLINFSGHPLSEEARDELSIVYSRIIESIPVDLIFDSSVESQIEKIIADLPVKVDGSFALSIIPPGQATFSILLVSYLHGLIGHFPNLCYLERSSSGVYLPKVEYEVQPQKIRSAGRKFRLSSYEV